MTGFYRGCFVFCFYFVLLDFCVGLLWVFVGFCVLFKNNWCFFTLNSPFTVASSEFKINKKYVYLFIFITIMVLSFRKDGSVLFHDALNTFSYGYNGVRHIVKDHSDSDRGNPLPPHGLLFPISSKGSFICTIPQTG